MSAVSSNTGDRESEALRRAQRAHEPSMEEILASIRNIIADDRENAKASGKAPGQRAAAQPAAGPQIVYSKDSAGATPGAPSAESPENAPEEAASFEIPAAKDRLEQTFRPCAGRGRTSGAGWGRPFVEIPVAAGCRRDREARFADRRPGAAE